MKTIKDKLIKFSKERDWEKFHTPKNLAMALTVEVSELLEIFQWSLDGGQDVIENSKEEIESEIADIFNYLVKLVDLLDIVHTSILQPINISLLFKDFLM